MRNVLVTGASGFIGKNLIEHLKKMENVSVLNLDLDNVETHLEEYVCKADFIYHLAGINRPKTEDEFDRGNRGLTEQIVELLIENKKQTPIIISSSIQATLDNPYGKSKNSAEKALMRYHQDTDAQVYIYRLQNVFGKWCRPNYNSVVATFCHNIAHNLPIQINDPAAKISLVYIDHVVDEFIKAMNGEIHISADGYCHIPKVYSVTLEELADIIHGFVESRQTLVLSNFDNEFERMLYATFLSYLPKDQFGYDLDMKHDNRGWLAEFVKSKQVGQIFISKTKPGITRGNHWHHTKVEKFLVINGTGVIEFRQIHGNEILEYPVSGDHLTVVDIPVGYTHRITNTGDDEMITLFWASEIFDSNKPDTHYLEV